MPEFEFEGKRPRVHPDAWVAPTALLIGDVGLGTNIQDNAVIHCSRDKPTLIGANVTVGHLACLEGCTVEDGAVVGIGSVMLQRTRLGERAMLAAGSVLPEGREVPAGHLAAGTPAEVKKELSGSSADWVERTAGHYQRAGVAYRESLVGVDRD